jgi:hypothetical protein
VIRDQLLELGMSTSAIDRRIAAGRLHRLYPGVYAVGDRALPTHGRLVAAVYAAGTDAVASHRSAAALHGLSAHHGWPEVIARPGTRKHDGIKIHRIPYEPDEVTSSSGSHARQSRGRCSIWIERSSTRLYAKPSSSGCSTSPRSPDCWTGIRGAVERLI